MGLTEFVRLTARHAVLIVVCTLVSIFAGTALYFSAPAFMKVKPPGSQLTVDLEWQAPDGGYPAQVGQFVAALTVNPSANEFFTAVTKELTTDM